MKLRDYQQDIYDQLIRSKTNDLVQLDTGAGKTPIEAALAQHAPRCLLVAHRNILIVQISEKLAAFKIDHDTISTEHTRRLCAAAHKAYNRCFINKHTKTHYVCSIDSLITRYKRGMLNIDTTKPWLIIIDEAHHVVPNNKWGSLKEVFKDSRIIGFTATPARLDGESLHVSSGGLFDMLVQAEALKENSVRKLIERGYISDFSVYAPSDIDLKSLRRDYNSLTIFGDPIKNYKKLAHGKQAVMMCPSIKNAEEFSIEFKKSGISSAHISSIQSATEINRVLNSFKTGEIKVLCNVDMITEGFDLPGIECLIIAARTGSLVRYRQWVGRALRHVPGKIAIIIDHVGIILSENGHGMPDEHISWNIEKPPKQVKDLQTILCRECGLYYKLKLPICPDCGSKNMHHVGQALGDYYVYINKLDHKLIAHCKKEHSLEQEKNIRENQIVIPNGYFSFFEVEIKKLMRWFADGLFLYGVEIRDINAFLHHPKICRADFWMSNFTIRDSKNDFSTHQYSRYKIWLKSI